MKELHNPYANALDGLIIDDPISAFFEFCRARESIRLKREQGSPPPWSNDSIFQKGRFLNVFREDDRGSQAILNFANNLETDFPLLVQSLFFARWCNRQETLNELSNDILSQPKKLIKRLCSFDPWCNFTAYPVETIYWEGQRYSRFDAATLLFNEIKHSLSDILIDSNGSVIKATKSINTLFKMKNDFPIFMAVIDVAWFRPDIIKPESHVPTGIGAVAYLDRLQAHLGLNDHHDTCQRMIELQEDYWPEAKRKFQPIDIEYLSCECRKYYSYVNGTKLFEGKNSFSPKKTIS